MASLQALCEAGSPVSLMSRDLLATHYGRFSSVDEESLIIDFPERPTGLPFGPPALCVVSFLVAEGSCLFTSHIKRNLGTPDGVGGRLYIAVPNAIRRAESRLAFRVPVGPDIDLGLRVATTRGTVLPGRVADISLCGVLAELGELEATGLSYDERVQVNLSMMGHDVQLRGAIRRVEPPRYGIYFLDAVMEGRLQPPRALQWIVGQLDSRGLEPPNAPSAG